MVQAPRVSAAVPTKAAAGDINLFISHTKIQSEIDSFFFSDPYVFISLLSMAYGSDAKVLATNGFPCLPS